MVSGISKAVFVGHVTHLCNLGFWETGLRITESLRSAQLTQQDSVLAMQTCKQTRIPKGEVQSVVRYLCFCCA